MCVILVFVLFGGGNGNHGNCTVILLIKKYLLHYYLLLITYVDNRYLLWSKYQMHVISYRWMQVYFTWTPTNTTPSPSTRWWAWACTRPTRATTSRPPSLSRRSPSLLSEKWWRTEFTASLHPGQYLLTVDRRHCSSFYLMLSPFRFPINTAYVEGWGLYSETLGFDINAYEDPLDRFGHLSEEIFRACRLGELLSSSWPAAEMECASLLNTDGH